jgi:hypothetical protein
VQRTYRGTDQLAAVPERLGRYHRTFHLLGQADLRVDGSEGEGQVHCVAHHLEQAHDGWWDRVLFIRYTDRYLAEDDRGWLIADRFVHVDWVERRAAVTPAEADANPKDAASAAER